MTSQDHSNCPVDPRIQVELETLNTATDNINKYEVELDEAKNDFKQLLVDSVDRIKQASHKLNNSIQTAKPYYEARLYAGQLAKEHRVAACNHERARSVHAVAKEMVYLAEQGLGEQSTLDTACQEMLSHAASRVNESQVAFSDTKNTMKICELKQEVANVRVAKLQSQLKSAIKASSLRIRRTLLMINFHLIRRDFSAAEPPYYETRANYNGLLKAQKNRITDLETRVREAKLTYNEALRLLEQISEEIHRQRGIDARALAAAAAGTSSAGDDDDTAKTTASVDSAVVLEGQQDEELPPYTRLSSAHSSAIFSADEYLEFPERLSTGASPVHQPHLAPLDFPHLMRDFSLLGPGAEAAAADESSSAAAAVVVSRWPETASASPLPFGAAAKNFDQNGADAAASSDIEQWTEIRLSKSESTSSGYSQHSQRSSAQNEGDLGTATGDGAEQNTPNTEDDDDEDGDDSLLTSGARRRRLAAKVTCSSLFGGVVGGGSSDDTKPATAGGGEGIAGWITKSNLKQSGRRQSLDILLDAGDRVKDVFATGFQRVGKSLERRNSESEMSGGSDAVSDGGGRASSAAEAASNEQQQQQRDFFSFGGGRSTVNDVLSDEQVENLLLSEDCAEMLRNVLNISK